MTGVPSNELKAYFAEAESWDRHRLREMQQSRRLAWCVAGVSALLGAAGCLAVSALAPLKRVEPFVVRVDRTTGAVDVVSGLTRAHPQTYEEAVTKYWLALYVRTRESWWPGSAEANFRQVSLLSTAAEQQRWADAFRATDAMSPQVLWGDKAAVDAQVRSVSFVSPSVAEVHFHRRVREGAEITDADFIATLSFAYTTAPMAEADRLKNPLGFQVARYRVDPEAAP